MKKLIFLLAAVFAVNVLPVRAAEDMNVIAFEPVGGGKFIYSNNPEELVREDLADDGETPEYIMNNSDLGADKYRLYMTHFNRVTKEDEEGKKYPGENLWLDAVFTAKEDCEIIFTRTAFEIPENVRTYVGYETITTERPWSALQATADLLGEPVHMLKTDLVFSPKKQTVRTITLKKGEKMFLSSIIENYAAVPYPKHVLMAADFEITHGKADADVFAARNRIVSAEGTVSYPDVNFDTCGYGIYKPGRTQKGIANSLPELKTSIEYEITDSTKDGAYIPVTVKNQYYPKGNFITEWVTNLNPQDDMYSKNLVDESNILPLFYEDESKLGYYGENIGKNERDSVWIFDTTHSDTMAWEEKMGVEEADYSPNYPLSADKNNAGYACSVGNYGVTLRYDMKITNNAAEKKYLEYAVLTAADIVVEVRGKNGELISPIVSKGQTNEITKDVMASVELPAGEVSEFSIGMMLPVQNYGGQRQSFTVRDQKNVNTVEKNTQVKPILTGDSDIDAKKLIDGANDRTRFILGGNAEDLKIVKTGSGYAAYYGVIEGNPYKYGYYWPITGKVFILDESFNITDELDVGSQPIEMTFAEGKLYIKTITNGSIVIAEGAEQEALDGYILPRENDESVVCAKDRNITVRADDGEMLKVKCEKDMPPYYELKNGLFCFATENAAGVSRDGIYWNYYGGGDNIQSALAADDGIFVNGELLKPFARDAARVILNNEFLGFSVPCEMRGDIAVMPMRFFFEELGMRVLWNSYKGSIMAFGAGGVFEFTPNSRKAVINGEETVMDAPAEVINGNTFIPVSILSRLSGFDYKWNEEEKTVRITGKIGAVTGDIEAGGSISVIARRNTKHNTGEE